MMQVIAYVIQMYKLTKGGKRMKKSNSGKIITWSVISVILLIIFFIVANIFEANNRSYGLYYVGNDEMQEIIDDTSGEGFFVYIGTPACPVCREFEPILERTLEYLGRELRYYHVGLARENDEGALVRILTRIDTATVPTIVYIKNGEVLDSIGGVQNREALISFFEENGGLN